MTQAEEGHIAPTRVAVAFDEYRREHGPARHPRGTQAGDLTVPMTWGDGLLELADGANDAEAGEVGPALATEWQAGDVHLWVVRTGDVVHAPESCEFGSQRAAGVVKHTNITGGAPAYAGGEAVFVGASQVVVNGSSGRYPVRSKEAMVAIEMAFKKSGYDVWSTGWDADGRKAVPFGVLTPRRVV